MIPWWKQCLSYLMPVHLETTGSAINDVLEVYLIRNRLRLTTHEAIYSYDDHYYNFVSAFKHVPLPADGAEVLLLGFGLGSIPQMLEKKFKKQYNYTAVEIDEAVISLFSRYQQPRLRSHMELHQGDAGHYMRIQDRCYDIICVDVFVGEIIPDHLKESEFLESLQNALNEDGLILWNMLYFTGSQKLEVDQFLSELFKEYFPNNTKHEVMGNVILMNKVI